jgi:oligoendopeptidase F
MLDSLPTDIRVVMKWAWPDFKPYYSDLEGRTLSASSVQDFLSDWTRVAELVEEAFSRLHVAKTVNTADRDAEQRFNVFLEDTYPKWEEAEQRLKEKLLKTGVVPQGFRIPLQKMRTEAEIFRLENLPLFVEEHKLATRYDKIVGAQTVEWEGREMTLLQLRPYSQSQDRDLREKVWRTSLQRQLNDREAIDNLWREFMAVRAKQAINAGFSDYRSFRWKQFLRFDYTPEDCKSFHKAIEEAVVPAAARVCERRRKLLGVEELRPWDLEVDPLGRPPLVPFQEAAGLRDHALAIFRKLDPVLGGYFETMINEGLLDLDNRKNKAPGGYCTEFAASKRPFIFMNAVGIQDDVQTLLHESGHAFHVVEKDPLPYLQQRQVGMEFSEVASMSMELLASPYLSADQGGFYSREDAARARTEHLERNILFWPYMAVVDAFQHWVYENPADAADPSNCNKAWSRTWRRFMPWIDWSGLETELMTGWHRKLHIHTVPLYYVEYGFALLGAVQVWGNSLRDRTGAIDAYRIALALGGTVPLTELFYTAGARFSFDAKTLGAAVSLMEGAIESLTAP